MTVSMLALAGIPATAGFTGKFYLIDAAVSGGYTWLGVVIVIGSMISLGYYLPVIAAIWMRSAPAGEAGTSGRGAPETPGGGQGLPALAGGSPELDEGSLAAQPTARGPQPEVLLVGLVSGAAAIFFGIVPQPLFELVHHAGSALTGLF